MITAPVPDLFELTARDQAARRIESWFNFSNDLVPSISSVTWTLTPPPDVVCIVQQITMRARADSPNFVLHLTCRVDHDTGVAAFMSQQEFAGATVFRANERLRVGNVHLIAPLRIVFQAIFDQSTGGALANFSAMGLLLPRGNISTTRLQAVAAV